MVSYILFDLDNTLYPQSSPIDTDITRRMTEFVASFIGVPVKKASILRSHGLTRWGTTLGWLKAEYNLTDIDAFLSAVHPPFETDGLVPDAHLRPFLQSLNLPMAILTNAPKEHADRVLKYFNVGDLFGSRVYDIRWANFKGKPAAETFSAAIAEAGFNLDTTLFLDDSPRYIDGFAAIGGQTLLVDQFDKYINKPYNRIHSVYDIKPFLQ